jgi:hypothetical protein
MTIVAREPPSQQARPRQLGIVLAALVVVSAVFSVGAFVGGETGRGLLDTMGTLALVGMTVVVRRSY